MERTGEAVSREDSSPLGAERCHRCDRPLILPSDPHAEEGCNGCEKCRKSCWSAVVMGECGPGAKAVDWRARALEAEAQLAEMVTNPASFWRSLAGDIADLDATNMAAEPIEEPEEYFTFETLPTTDVEGAIRMVGARDSFYYVSFRNGEWWIPTETGALRVADRMKFAPSVVDPDGVRRLLTEDSCDGCRHLHFVVASSTGTSSNGWGCLLSGGHAVKKCKNFEVKS